MAIDTETKRKSMLNFSDGALLPVADGTIAQGDRFTFLDLYSGIAAAAVIAGPCWAAGEVYAPGFKESDIYHPRFAESDVYHPGFQEAEREC